ncbi:IS4 family transposase [Metallumcola ferriviriculae]|uniref:IS4 family transposase n=1 Tax=Metallumcola ferriviriculae TaxID=3039180 RepID=A0AAU0UQQ6_9FIRM|nr:IS4 family transposase [Desulfitibacteraceae bacterium MK1]
MWDKDTRISTFLQLFKPILNGQFFKQIKDLGVDKYVKKLFTTHLIIFMIYAQLEQLKSLRAISNSLNNQDSSQAIALESISFSQISRRLNNLPTEVFQTLFKHLTFKVLKEAGVNALNESLQRIHIIDSSTISLCLTDYRWADFRTTKAGVKLHLRLRFFEKGVLPEEAVITPAKPADKTQMDALVVDEEGALNVFDRAYVDYRKFDSYCENGTRFVTRLKGIAIKEVVEELPIDTDGPLKKHQIVLLGNPYTNKMKHKLRLIETVDTEGKPVIIITNDFDLTAEEIGDIYKNRWQTEIFFKWLKQHLKVKHFHGKSEQAVKNQLFIALITYCLLKMLELKTGYKGPLLTIKRLLKTCLYEPFNCFVQKLYKKPTRPSKGRRRPPDHEAIYQETLRQVIAGETDHLNDLDYDPVIL